MFSSVLGLNLVPRTPCGTNSVRESGTGHRGKAPEYAQTGTLGGFAGIHRSLRPRTRSPPSSLGIKQRTILRHGERKSRRHADRKGQAAPSDHKHADRTRHPFVGWCWSQRITVPRLLRLLPPHLNAERWHSRDRGRSECARHSFSSESILSTSALSCSTVLLLESLVHNS